MNNSNELLKYLKDKQKANPDEYLYFDSIANETGIPVEELGKILISFNNQGIIYNAEYYDNLPKIFQVH